MDCAQTFDGKTVDEWMGALVKGHSGQGHDHKREQAEVTIVASVIGSLCLLGLVIAAWCYLKSLRVSNKDTVDEGVCIIVLYICA